MHDRPTSLVTRARWAVADLVGEASASLTGLQQIRPATDAVTGEDADVRELEESDARALAAFLLLTAPAVFAALFLR